MKMIRGLAIVGAMGAALVAQGASAQNVGNNAGIWWTPAAGQPSAFTFLNPLSTVYGRIGFQRAFQENSSTTFSPPAFPPGFFGANLADSWGMHLGLGVRLMPVLRYELQLGGQFNTISQATLFGAPLAGSNGRVSSAQLMNNLYVDIAPFFGNNLWGLNPYLMGGIGVSWNNNGDFNSGGTNVPGTSNTHTSFAWNAGVGVQWQAMRNLILDVGYRYLDAGRWQTTPVAAFPISARNNNTSHQIMFSVVVPVDGLIRGFGN